MTWFSFTGGWGDYNLNGVAEKTLVGLGAKGYATQAEADAHSVSPGVDEQAYLQTLKVASVSPIGAGATSGDLSTPSSTGGVSGAIKNLVPSTFQLVTGNTGGLLTRFLKITIGGILLISGILILTNSDKKLEQILPLIGGPAGKVLKA